jgi:hypothetical protein
MSTFYSATSISSRYSVELFSPILIAQEKFFVLAGIPALGMKFQGFWEFLKLPVILCTIVTSKRHIFG